MTARDRIIRELVNALDSIQREASKPEASRHYITGIAEQAIENWKARCEHNSDGYLVVKGEANFAEISELRERIEALERAERFRVQYGVPDESPDWRE